MRAERVADKLAGFWSRFTDPEFVCYMSVSLSCFNIRALWAIDPANVAVVWESSALMMHG